MGDVTINGVRYVLAEQEDKDKVPRAAIQQTYVQRLGESIRLKGVQSTEQDTSVNRWRHFNFLQGFGPLRINRETGKGLGSFKDATCMTDYPSGVYLPLLAQNSTEPTNGTSPRRIVASISFGGNLWGLWEDEDATGALLFANRYAGSTTSWTGGGTVIAAGTAEKVPLDIMAYKTGMIALCAQSTNHLTRTSTDGITWGSNAGEITANLISGAVSGNDAGDYGLLIEIGNEKVAVLWDEVSGTITFFSGTTLTGAWADETLDIPSGNGPQGVAVYPDIDGVTKLYVMAREGLWMVDTVPVTWTARKVLDLPAHNDNGRRMTLHQGKLWFGVGVDNNSPAPIWTMEVRGDLRIFDTRQGLDQADGLPAEMMGPVRWMKSAGKRLFASIGGGAASRNGRVIVHNGEGWHSRFRNGTANQQVQWIDVSPDDDGTQRLHFALRTATTTSDTQFQAQPLVDPAAAVTMAYATSGYLRIPAEDLGDPQTVSALYRAYIYADDLSAATTGEYIQLQNGLDGDADTTNDQTNFLSGTRTLVFGTNGVRARRVDMRLTFNRDGGSTADSPKMREFEFRAQAILLASRAWQFTIDVEATARAGYRALTTAGNAQELIISDIESLATATAASVNALFLFQYAQEVAALRVRIPNGTPPNFRVWKVGDSRENLGYRTGFIDLRLEEVVA